MKESFIFYRSFYEALKELSKEDRVEIVDAICELALNETEVELKGGIQKAMFALIKPQIEANNKRYVNGCRAKTKQKASEKQADDEQSESDIEAKRERNRSEREARTKQSISKDEAKGKRSRSKPEANENVNDNVNENVNDKEKEKEEKELPSSDDTCMQGEKDDKIPYEDIIAYFNKATGKAFTTKTQATKSKIKARWREGFRLKDFQHVIDVKTSQWLHNDDMERYLRPDTLFGTKFESYLNEPVKPRMNTGLPDWYANTEFHPVDPDTLARALEIQKKAFGDKENSKDSDESIFDENQLPIDL